MRSQDYAVFGLPIETRYEIDGGQNGAVIGPYTPALAKHGIGVFQELGFQVSGALGLGFGSGYTGAKCQLLGYILVRRISIKT